ncbi:MAG: redoxin domain-containing protein [Armatimonadetes bacterium]|nr:redoxin domain-containing protein [Armatimonadota bacterium]
MKLRRLSAFAAATALVGAAGALALAPHLPEGATAPGFGGKATDGKEYSLKKMVAEGTVFVVFWKERCPHNPRAAPMFNELYKVYEGKAKLIGVVSASPDGAKKWSDRFNVTYPLLSDGAKEVIKSYKMKYSIGTMQIAQNGKIIKVFAGYGKAEMESLNEAMAEAAGTKRKAINLDRAPGLVTWG